jgi:hypothetical protein
MRPLSCNLRCVCIPSPQGWSHLGFGCVESCERMGWLVIQPTVFTEGYIVPPSAPRNRQCVSVLSRLLGQVVWLHPPVKSVSKAAKVALDAE